MLVCTFQYQASIQYTYPFTLSHVHSGAEIYYLCTSKNVPSIGL